MAIIACSECTKEISDKAMACPHCGAPLAKEKQKEVEQHKYTTWQPSSEPISLDYEPPPSEPKKKRGIWMWIFAGIGLFFLYAIIAPTSPLSEAKQKQRAAIKYCWNEQARKSHDPESARFIAGACEKMENDFKSEYHVDP